LDYYSQALPLNKAVGDRSGEALTLYNIAYLETNRGNLQAALTPMQASIDILEDLRTKIISPELRQTYFATVQNYYQFYIDLLMKLHQQNPSQGYDQQAFNISERSRARTLLELLTESQANIKEGIEPQLLAQEKDLQGQLDTVEKQRLEIYNKPNSTDEQKNAINERQKTLINQYRDLQNEIRAKSPKYAALKYPQPLTLAQVQQQILDPDTALLQYSVGKEKSYLWIISKNGFTSHILPAQKEIETAARELLNAIQYGKDDTANINQAANQLSQLILTPAAKLNQKRLIIVPDGVLSYVPFSTLTLNDKPLINQHELVNLPSSSSIAIIRQETQNRKPAPKALALLADPIFSADDPRLKTPQKQPISQTNPDLNQLAINRVTKTLKKSRAVGDNNQFTRLPGTRQEAQAILALLPKTETIVAFDDQANLNLAINPQLSQYRMIHLATHGVFNGEDPAYSGIILSLVDAKGTSINGFLRLNEIFNLNLPAELVVLSACETGLGQEIKGEGLVGLTRGFMYAGTPRVLVSLWKVDDQATAEMMTRFYKLILEKKLPPAQALREAQLQMQTETEWKSPYYWSAFVLEGEWR
jgi:CHAT domain-containing protein